MAWYNPPGISYGHLLELSSYFYELTWVIASCSFAWLRWWITIEIAFVTAGENIRQFKRAFLDVSLPAEGPKFDLRSTHARTSWDPNNAFPWGVRRHISKVFITKVGRTWRFSISHVPTWRNNPPGTLRKCIVVVTICSGMAATNSISRAPTDFSRQTMCACWELRTRDGISVFRCIGKYRLFLKYRISVAKE